MNTKRLEYIDYVEALAIFMVVFCHFPVSLGNSLSSNIAQQFASTIGVPLFFLANGTLLLRGKFNLKKHMKKTLNLFLAVNLWKIIILVIIYLQKGSHSKIWSFKQLLNYFSGDTILDPYVPAGHFWYIYALIGIYLLYPFIKLAYDNYRKLYNTAIIIGLVMVLFYSEMTGILFYIGKWTSRPTYELNVLADYMYPIYPKDAIYILYFMIGPLIHEKIYDRSISSKKRIILGLIAVCSFVGMLLQKYLQCKTLRGSWIRFDNDYMRLTTLVMSISIFCLFASCKKFNKKLSSVATFISLRTFNIYAIHMLLCYEFVEYIYPDIEYPGLSLHLLRTLVVVILSLIITYILSLIKFVRSALRLYN